MKRGNTNWTAGLDQIGPVHSRTPGYRVKSRRRGGFEEARHLGQHNINNRAGCSTRSRRVKITLPKITFEGVS